MALFNVFRGFEVMHVELLACQVSVVFAALSEIALFIYLM